MSVTLYDKVKIRVPSGRIVSVTIGVDQYNKTVHILDNDEGVTLTNCIDDIFLTVFQVCGCAGDVHGWNWYLYHTDAAVSFFDTSKCTMQVLSRDYDVLYQPFVRLLDLRESVGNSMPLSYALEAIQH